MHLPHSFINSHYVPSFYLEIRNTGQSIFAIVAIADKNN